MGLRRACWPDRLRSALAVGLLSLFVQGSALAAQLQTPGKYRKKEPAPQMARDFRSRNFLVHTDLCDREANNLVAELETMLRQVSGYWGRPLRGMIECYVVRDFADFPLDAMEPEGISGIKTAGGYTLMRTATAGECYLAKSVVYASARTEVVRHEAVHAYCHQTFGRVGPVWYSEGMAEMGHYWKEGDSAVRVAHREVRFLRQNPPKSLAATLSLSQVSGDSWQNYASRWALCHFLVHDPNYSSQFASLGREILAGNDASFNRTYGPTSRELWFEYQFFIDHIDRGYRVDLCAWDWNKKFDSLRPGRTVTASIRAGRGWQPTGLTVSPGVHYQCIATGKWRVATEPRSTDGDGDDHGCGRLVGVLMKDYRLGPEFDVGGHGSLQSTTGGNLYLRCRNAWNDLADDTGRLAVKLKIQDGGGHRHKAEAPLAAAATAAAVGK